MELIEITHKYVDLLDMNYFKQQLAILKSEVDKAQDKTSESRKNEKLYKSLSTLSDWHEEYNMVSDYPSELYETTRMIQMKVRLEKTEMANLEFDKFLFESGMYSPVDLYIIPFAVVGVSSVEDYDSKQVFKLFKKLAYDFQVRGVTYGLPVDDMMCGTMRCISNTHFAVIKRSNSNPFSYKIMTNSNWRFIHKSGYAL